MKPLSLVLLALLIATGMALAETHLVPDGNGGFYVRKSQPLYIPSTTPATTNLTVQVPFMLIVNGQTIRGIQGAMMNARLDGQYLDTERLSLKLVGGEVKEVKLSDLPEPTRNSIKASVVAQLPQTKKQ